MPRTATLNKISYFKWLSAIAMPDHHERYTLMLRKLFTTDARVSVGNDGDRLADGLVLREDYALFRTARQLMWYDDPCSLLEMMVAIARRMDDILTDPDKPGRIHVFFHQLLKNTGFWDWDDDNYPENMVYLVDMRLDQLLRREYESSGKGGFFPLKNPSSDQREVEIWYQMQAFISENYPLY